MYLTYADILRPQTKRNAQLYDLFLILAGSAFIALLAQIAFDLPGGIPITGQTFGVLLIAALLGRIRGTAAILAYLAEGAMGLPVFANGGAGTGVLTGSSGGYLVGFVLAAGLVGWLAERGWDRHILTTILAMLAGNIVIYMIGVPWLKQLLATSWSQALAWGLTPFIIGDLIKVGLAAGLLPLGWRLFGKDR